MSDPDSDEMWDELTDTAEDLSEVFKDGRDGREGNHISLR